MRQLFRYALVGIASNLAGYLLYLLITHAGVAPKLAMTLLYAVGAALGFVGNRTFTFGHTAAVRQAGLRYVLSHLLGYFINLAIQIIMVDKLGFAHQLAQALGICVVAVFLFLMFKFFVFAAGRVEDEEAHEKMA